MYKCHHYQRTNNVLTLLDNQVVHKVKEQSFPHFPHTLLACSLTSVHARMLYTFKKLVAVSKLRPATWLPFLHVISVPISVWLCIISGLTFFFPGRCASLITCKWRYTMYQTCSKNKYERTFINNGMVTKVGLTYARPQTFLTTPHFPILYCPLIACWPIPFTVNWSLHSINLNFYVMRDKFHSCESSRHLVESFIYNFLVEYYEMRHSTTVGKDKYSDGTKFSVISVTPPNIVAEYNHSILYTNFW